MTVNMLPTSKCTDIEPSISSVIQNISITLNAGDRVHTSVKTFVYGGNLFVGFLTDSCQLLILQSLERDYYTVCTRTEDEVLVVPERS